ncbi:diguanylate cyclase [bacterium]|nr:diguanylate cyclase [bacterium]
MPDDLIYSILDICLKLDSLAHETYLRFADVASSEVLSDFWKIMAAEEKQHITFWKALLDYARERKLPPVLEQPLKILEDLRTTYQKAQDLVHKYEPINSDSNAFQMAYRMEFHFLHPTFSTLFHTLHLFATECPNPEEGYQSHLNRFIEGLVKFGDVTPEMEMLGDTLQQLWKENQKLAHQAQQDSLTGLLNMRTFLGNASQLAALASRNHHRLGIMMVDIDNFKLINDNYGHQEGDRILKSIALILMDNIRSSDLLARYGGDEFIALFYDPQTGMANQIAEKVRAKIFESNLDSVPTTASIGVSEQIIGQNYRNQIKELITKADERMYRAKEEGKNRVVSLD